jgi:hypothetical protein
MNITLSAGFRFIFRQVPTSVYGPRLCEESRATSAGMTSRVIAIDQHRFGNGTERWGETMLINLKVNARTSRVGSAAELKQELAPFASRLRADSGGPSLCALMNTNAGWLMYLSTTTAPALVRATRCSTNPALCDGLVFDDLFDGEHVPVVAYRLSNGQRDQYPASGRCLSRARPGTTLYKFTGRIQAQAHALLFRIGLEQRRPEDAAGASPISLSR